MRKSTALVLTIIAALIAVALPMLFAVQVAKEDALKASQNAALAIANDVLARSERTADQLEIAIDDLDHNFRDAPCSLAGTTRMREHDLASPNVEAFGYVSGNKLACSSMGAEASGVDLGPVDFVQPRGVELRVNAKLPFVDPTHFLVVEYKQFAGIVHKDVPLAVTTAVPGMALAVFSTANTSLMLARGRISQDWLVTSGRGVQSSFVNAGYVVATVTSRRRFFGAVAALPMAQLESRVRTAALTLVPVGFGAGLLLATIVFYIGRLQMGLPSLIRAALSRDEFFMAYQPIVDLRTGKWVGAEALIRWRRRRGEVVWPDDFIPAAEESGLIVRITERVVQLVARDAATLFQQRRQFHLAINLASADLHDEFTVRLLQRLARQTGAGPGNLMVEATERGFTDPDSAGQIIRDLRANGIRVAIDDFGTGYSSLSYLEQFEVDLLKIDKSFVDTLGTGAANGAVAVHIIEMAKALNLEMIAEGVSTHEQAQFLRERGVQYAQGWLFAQPMKIDELVAMLDKHDPVVA
jgi:sensor c-di-GMP phosphodiesterase-like protein